MLLSGCLHCQLKPTNWTWGALVNCIFEFKVSPKPHYVNSGSKPSRATNLLRPDIECQNGICQIIAAQGTRGNRAVLSTPNLKMEHRTPLAVPGSRNRPGMPNALEWLDLGIWRSLVVDQNLILVYIVGIFWGSQADTPQRLVKVCWAVPVKLSALQCKNGMVSYQISSTFCHTERFLL